MAGESWRWGWRVSRTSLIWTWYTIPGRAFVENRNKSNIFTSKTAPYTMKGHPFFFKPTRSGVHIRKGCYSKHMNIGIFWPISTRKGRYSIHMHILYILTSQHQESKSVMQFPHSPFSEFYRMGAQACSIGQLYQTMSHASWPSRVKKKKTEREEIVGLLDALG